MKKNTKSFLIITSILIGVIYLFFNYNHDVNAQVEDTIFVQTTGYSALSASSFIFGGYYDGYHGNKGFTTYFEFKEDNQNLDVDVKETIKIIRDTDIEESNEFYTNPELKAFSNYYFRAVGYFNDNPSQKFYGDIQNIRTGVFPRGIGSYPFTVGRGIVDDGRTGLTNIAPVCTSKSLNVLTNTCDTPPGGVRCSSPEIYSFLKQGCVNLTTPKCTPQQSYDFSSNTCKRQCDFPEVYNILTKGCDAPNPIIVPNPGTNPNPGLEVKPSDTGIVPCDGSDANPCGFEQVMKLINDVIKFIFKYLAIPLAAIMFAYAGFELVTSGGSTEKKSKAKSIIINVAIGLVLAAAAFVIVQTVLSIMGFTGDTFLKK